MKHTGRQSARTYNFQKKDKKFFHQIFTKLKFYYVIHMQGFQKCQNFQKISIFCLSIMTKQLICNLLSTVLNKGLQFLKTIYTKSFFGIGLLQVDAG